MIAALSHWFPSMIARIERSFATRGAANPPARLATPKTAISAPIAAGVSPCRFATTTKMR